MKKIKVLGSGCAKCSQTAEMIADISEEMGIDVIVKKDTDPQSLLKFHVMKTPAVVIDDELIHSGSVPTRDEVEGWLRD
ncbi:thioredoxin family protein [Shewanella sp. MF08487]|uniref:thioredoxin family protein n=1 Tax=Shewanella sp. MF08487 TaxID=3434873 RepID=UPI003D790C4D